MTAILGIDAAWTSNQPSGVALIEESANGWRTLYVAPSYDAFTQCGDGRSVDWNQSRIAGSDPNIKGLLRATGNLGANNVELIALDIPLARSPVTSRRTSDISISKAFGAKGCSTHSPNEDRPGKVSARLSRQLDASGFLLEAARDTNKSSHRAIEVYPHPALLKLTDSDYRIPYKVSRSTKYWRGTTVAERIVRILSEFDNIYRALEAELGKLPFALPKPEAVTTLSRLKRYEDALDALACAWVGKQHLLGQTLPYGDENSAIWVPC